MFWVTRETPLHERSARSVTVTEYETRGCHLSMIQLLLVTAIGSTFSQRVILENTVEASRLHEVDHLDVVCTPTQ